MNKDKLIAAAQKLVEKGSFEKAIKEYLKVVADDDKDVRVWLKVGDLYAKVGKKPEAAETYQKVAQFYSDQGFYLKAVAVYKQILKLDPRLIEVNQRLAELYKQLGLLSDAMQQYEAVAGFYQSEGKPREALFALKQMVELDPQAVASRIKLAELYSKEQMAPEAVEELTKAADQLRGEGRTDDFLKVAERILFHAPDNRAIAKELAALYIDKGDPRHALPKLQVCFKGDPRDTEVLGLLASAFEALEQRAKSVSVLKELARIHGENGDAKAREAAFRKILTLVPGDPDAEAALGRQAGSTGSRPAQRRGSSAARVAPRREGGSGRVSTLKPPPVDDFAAPPTTGVEDADLDDGAVPTASTVSPAALSEEEEIRKIVNETDVYIKYNLHTKAIEHIQRVFERDSRNVEAREKLKALYLMAGKREEAVLELWSLAEQAEPGRARRYLREILELDPDNARAKATLGAPLDPPGRRAALASEPSKAEPTPELLDVEELEELPDADFELADPSGVGGVSLADDDEIIPTMAGRASAMALDLPPPDESGEDLIPLVVEPTRTPAIEPALEIEDRFGLDESIDDAGVDGLPLAGDEGPLSVAVHNAMPPGEEGTGVELGARPAIDLPLFAEELDSDASAGHGDEAPGEGTRPAPLERIVPESGAYQPDGEELHTRFDAGPLKFIDQAGLTDPGVVEIDDSELPEVTGLVAPEIKVVTRTMPNAAAPPVHSESSLEDDLDEADFFVQQSLFDEAKSILEGLLTRHPGHPLVGAKLRDLEAMEQVRREAITEKAPTIEEIAAELSSEVPAEAVIATAVSPLGEEDTGLQRRGVIEQGVTAEDFETHYDLGIAYKEMGLIDDAMAEFNLVMKDPPREVQCHLMIGLCLLEKGMQTEAIAQFKKGLYVEGIKDREALSLYFELGQAYEALNDPREALYYYEKVIKRDPNFREVEQRVAALRGDVPTVTGAPAPSDDVDAAFETLLGGDNS